MQVKREENSYSEQKNKAERSVFECSALKAHLHKISEGFRNIVATLVPCNQRIESQAASPRKLQEKSALNQGAV